MDRFYDEQTEASQLKAEIVSKYFAAWANVIASQQTDRIGYLDLFCGPGRYEDGNPSTPLLVLEKAINHFNPKVCQKLVLTFNDSDPAKIAQLESEIDNLPDIHKLYFKPKTSTVRIGDRMVRAFENIVKMPTLSFIDPWGYKGLSLSLVRNLVKHWGCDSIFFFNYRRINPGIENPALQRPISLLFTEEVLNELRMKVMQKEPEEREKLIVSKVCDVFEDWGMGYVLPFPFKNQTGTRTAHYLIFVSKNILGYDIMKGILGTCSSCYTQGVPSFEYNPAARTAQLQLFDNPLDRLKEMLLIDFAGMTITTEEIYRKHNVGKPFIEKNYKAALLQLEDEGKIRTDRAIRKARRSTFPDRMIVEFPSRN